MPDCEDCQLCDGAGLVEGRAAGPRPAEIRAAIAAGASFCSCGAGAAARRLSGDGGAAGGERGLWEISPPAKSTAPRRPARPASKADVARTVAKLGLQRSAVDGFLREMCSAIPRRVTRRDFWRVAGYVDASVFKKWQRGTPVSAGARRRFERVLQMAPAEFLAQIRLLRGSYENENPAKHPKSRYTLLIFWTPPGSSSGMEHGIAVQIERSFAPSGSLARRSKRADVVLTFQNLAMANVHEIIDRVLGPANVPAELDLSAAFGPGAVPVGNSNSAKEGR